jgi:DNA-directed RNA polymerase subunit RPC12/RpoP
MPVGTARLPEHGHRFVLKRIMDGFDAKTGERMAWHDYACDHCGLEIVGEWRARRPKGVRYRGGAPPYLHTCSRCGKKFRDGHPFSELNTRHADEQVKFCSEDCLLKARSGWRKHDLLQLLPTLERMVRTATDETARARARHALEAIADDEDDMLRTRGKEALGRLGRRGERAGRRGPA